jgi:CRP/FNR family transcriptional regulator
MSVFCDLEKEETDRLNSDRGNSLYKNGQVVFSQGSYPHGLFVISSGKVKIYQLADNGKEQIVRMAKEGDIIGHRALLSNEKYTSTAEALEESSICFIPRQLFLDFISKNGSVSMALIKLLSHDLKHAEQMITDIAQKPVRERMAEALLYIKGTFGLEADNATINVVLTREEIANIAGTTMETAIRVLSEFRQHRLVEFLGKKIRILDMKALVLLANAAD